jgi:diguanylate cyclase (GGDEF)-like protein
MFYEIKRCFYLIYFTIYIIGSVFAIKAEKSLVEQNFTNWTTKQGLPTDTILDIYQDDFGYIWLASYMGLIRFDGIKFKLFNKRTTPAFESNSARVIEGDDKGNLWIGTNSDGLIHKNGSDYTKYTVEDGLPDNSVRSLVVDDNGVLWIGTINGIAVLVDGVLSTVTSPKFGLTSMLYKLKDGRIIASSSNNGLYQLNYKTEYLFSEIPLFKIFEFSSAAEDHEGRLWLGTTTGKVLIYDNGKVSINPYFDLGNNSVRDIFCDSKGVLWIATDRGLGRYYNNEFQFFSEEEDLHSNILSSVIEDQEGNLWISSEREGLSKFSENKFNNILVNDEHDNNSQNAIWSDGIGTIYAATDNGLQILKNDNMIKNNITDILSGVRIRHVFQDSQEVLWFSTYSDLGLVRYKNGEYQFFTEKNGLPINRVRLSYEDKQNNLWIGTTSGLGLLKNGEISYFNRNNGLSNDFIMGIIQLSSGEVWIATDGGGVNVYDGNSFRTLGLEQGIPSGIIFKIYEDSKNRVWICTPDGLAVYTNGVVQTYTSSDGLPTDTIYQIIEDGNGFYWMVTDKGLLKISDNELNGYDKSTPLSSILYDQSDGIAGSLTGTGWAFIDDNDKLYLPTYNGISILNTRDNISSIRPPPLKIEEILIDNKKYIPSNNIEIPADTLRITITFTALSYINPEKVQLKYKLDGYDREWSQYSSDRTVSYTNLSPGNYTFIMTARNNDLVENPEYITLEIIQKPHYYETILFYVIVIVSLFILIALIYKQREKEILRKQQLLEEMVKLKTADLAKANVELKKLATTDKLTGLFNRVRLDELLVNETKRIIRTPNINLGLIMLDVDKFKAINDTYGHQVGDIVLVEIAAIIKKTVRTTDFPGRWGGEEFLIVCIDTDVKGVTVLAEKIRKELELYNFPEIDVTQGTASFGVTQYRKDESINEMLIRADKALYNAKENGRNRVVAVS